MEMNLSISSISMNDEDSFDKYMRLINSILSCTGVLSNFLLIILLLSIGRRQCATYFLLILMTLCDFLYCTVYVSIMLTIDQYINIINHQIICPLSFFLTPFTFTGSTLLLFICLLHFITNYVRKYDTILGQISGRLSVVFVLAFIIIRSVLSSTSIELVIPDPNFPHIQLCTVHMNTTIIVATVQKINHIFAEVSDILVYIGWIIILFIYLINLLRYKKSSSFNQRDPTLSSMVRPFSYPSLLIVNHTQNIVTTTRYSFDMVNETTVTTISNKQRHNDISLIILSISLISVLFYSPIMISKYLTMYFVYYHRPLLTSEQTYFLQMFQHAAHLFCLSIRFLPYLIFDKRIHVFLNQIIGMKCMKIERRKTLSRKRKHKYTWHCSCHRRQQILEFTDHNEDKHQDNKVIKN